MTDQITTSDAVEVIADYPSEIGENPLWHEEEQRLYWTDIAKGKLYRFDPRTDYHEQCYEGRPVGGFTIQADGSLLLFMDRGAVKIWRGTSFDEVIPELPGEIKSRFNDVIADPRGRVFCGTMSTSEAKGRLYRLDTDGTCNLLLESIGCSNGMAFSSDLKSFYHTDSFTYEISVFDYEIETGTIENRKVFRQFDESDGMPDGMTIDAEGFFWIAFWGGKKVIKMGSDGKVIHTIIFPVPKVSSVSFGGPDYTDLYVTSAGGNMRDEDGAMAGSLFRLKNLGRGLPEYYSNIRRP